MNKKLIITLDGTDASASTERMETGTLSEDDIAALNRIFALLRTFSAVDFSQYRRTTVLRRINRRIGLRRLNTSREYANLLDGDTTELAQLYSDLLLSFTQFFRDPHIFDILHEKVFPFLTQGRSAKSPIRIWVPGCSTGEEVYSLAISLYEFLEKSGASVNVQFFGTDLVEQNIIKARSGVYSGRIAEQVNDERLHRFFDSDGDGYRVTKTIREMCVFATQDITRDPPFPNIDLISCRNVLIYFNEPYQDIVFPLFHFALKPGGYLMLGSSETVGRFPQLFSPFEARANIFRKRGMSSSVMYRLPFYQGTEKGRSITPADRIRTAEKESSVSASQLLNEMLADEFAPPGVLVDSSLLIRQFLGKPHPFISPGTGEASLKLSKMALETLLPDLYVAIEECKKSETKVTCRDLRFLHDGKEGLVDITILPFKEPSSPLSFLILFASRDAFQQTETLPNDASGDDSEINRIKQDLQVTRNHLQAIIEEKDEVNLELWAANEEVQSTNEELQSVNEEMEAAKEELESSNEELMALNEELQAKNSEISEREQLLRELFDNMVDGFASHRMIYDDNGKAVDYEFVEVNRVFSQRLGMVPEVLAGKTAKALEPNIEQYWIDLYDTVARTGKPHLYTSYAKAEDKHYETRLYRPKPGYCAAIVRDVSEQVRTDQALRASERKLKSYIESSPHGIFVADEVGHYLEVNDAACAITGYARDELVGMSFSRLIHPDDITRARQHFEAVRIDGEAKGEMRFITKSGNTRYWQVDAVKLSENRFLGIASDFTESQLIREKMRQSEKMRAVGQLAGGIAHDFNNQLSGILGFAELLQDEMRDSECGKKYIENIVTAVAHSADLTTKLLAFSQKGKYLDVTLDVHQLIREVMALLQHSVDKNVELLTDFNAPGMFVKGDPTQLQNAILNLALNARDAMPNGGKLRFSTRNTELNADLCQQLNVHLPPGKYIAIDISDSGLGMSEEVQAHIFEPFFTTKVQGKGVGMGLSAAYGTAQHHNGALVFSSKLNAGSTFTMYLPVDSMAQPQNTDLDNPPLSKHISNAHILFVDDDVTICRLSETILESLNYRVTVCPDGESALRYYKDNWCDVDLVILDMVMPNMSGKDAFVAMKQINPEIRAIVSSGYSVEGHTEELRKLGVCDFIQKPFRRAVLSQKIKSHLRASGESGS
ncbi:MAG: PAS domain S-box protein [Deltaproteobacteria bacterium]|nr:PAS domain S-box protein [Deltaproteobacteria bacterium]